MYEKKKKEKWNPHYAEKRKGWAMHDIINRSKKLG